MPLLRHVTTGWKVVLTSPSLGPRVLTLSSCRSFPPTQFSPHTGACLFPALNNVPLSIREAFFSIVSGLCVVNFLFEVMNEDWDTGRSLGRAALALWSDQKYQWLNPKGQQCRKNRGSQPAAWAHCREMAGYCYDMLLFLDGSYPCSARRLCCFIDSFKFVWPCLCAKAFQCVIYMLLLGQLISSTFN